MPLWYPVERKVGNRISTYPLVYDNTSGLAVAFQSLTISTATSNGLTASLTN